MKQVLHLTSTEASAQLESLKIVTDKNITSL